jgi:hypothetical protein
MHSRAGVIFTKSVLTGINVISAKKTWDNNGLKGKN